MKTFDFKNNNIEILDLETLKSTHKENDIFGNPLKGVYHFQLINQVAEICKNNGLNYEIEEIFAAQNKSRQNPGVVILPQVEEIHGENSAQAHILRRVYTTIRLKDMETEELTSNLVIAYHQDGVQIAFGPCVRICHNQCILNRERITSNFGKDKVSNDDMFASVDKWMKDFFNYHEQDVQIIEKMKKIDCSQNDVFQIIGLLTSLRVAKDSENPDIREGIDVYPLTQAQISRFTEDYLERKLINPNFTLWDVYNLATELYKPGRTDIPNLIPQNIALVEVLTNRFGL